MISKTIPASSQIHHFVENVCNARRVYPERSYLLSSKHTALALIDWIDTSLSHNHMENMPPVFKDIMGLFVKMPHITAFWHFGVEIKNLFPHFRNSTDSKPLFLLDILLKLDSPKSLYHHDAQGPDWPTIISTHHRRTNHVRSHKRSTRATTQSKYETKKRLTKTTKKNYYWIGYFQFKSETFRTCLLSLSNKNIAACGSTWILNILWHHPLLHVPIWTIPGDAILLSYSLNKLSLYLIMMSTRWHWNVVSIWFFYFYYDQ